VTDTIIQSRSVSSPLPINSTFARALRNVFTHIGGCVARLTPHKAKRRQSVSSVKCAERSFNDRAELSKRWLAVPSPTAFLSQPDSTWIER
jgi:hypothetical protein